VDKRWTTEGGGAPRQLFAQACDCDAQLVSAHPLQVALSAACAERNVAHWVAQLVMRQLESAE
jgi:hypothetical protein